MPRRKKTTPVPIDPVKTWSFSGRDIICRNCGLHRCIHSCPCHAPLRTDRCPRCGGEFWGIWSIVDWEGTEAEYERVRKAIQAFGMDYTSPLRQPVPKGIVTNRKDPGLRYGRGYVIAPVGQNPTHTSSEVEKVFFDITDEGLS